MHCHQIIISEKERTKFYEKQYEDKFKKDKRFSEFLNAKVKDIINAISNNLPKTKIEEVKTRIFN